MTNGAICKNCGGEDGIHHYQSNQCPVGGREAPVGTMQEWKTSTFEADIPFSPLDQLASQMTVRQLFAAMAMQGVLSNPECIFVDRYDEHGGLIQTGIERMREYCVERADALIAALNK